MNKEEISIAMKIMNTIKSLKDIVEVNNTLTYDIIEVLIDEKYKQGEDETVGECGLLNEIHYQLRKIVDITKGTRETLYEISDTIKYKDK